MYVRIKYFINPGDLPILTFPISSPDVLGYLPIDLPRNDSDTQRFRVEDRFIIPNFDQYRPQSTSGATTRHFVAPIYLLHIPSDLEMFPSFG